MATIICVDGLSGNPRLTFFYLASALSVANHTVVFLPDLPYLPVVSHSNRVEDIYRAFNRVKGDSSVFLIGQSAGGSAVLQATSRITDSRLRGIVILSPAMPSGINYLTPTLFRIMFHNLYRLFGNKPFKLKDEELLALLHPVPDKYRDRIIRDQTEIHPREARRLAFFPPRLRPIGVPCLHLYGAQDRWISPSAQVRLSASLNRMCQKYRTIEVPDSGHMTLLNPATPILIMDWIRDGLDSCNKRWIRFTISKRPSSDRRSFLIYHYAVAGGVWGGVTGGTGFVSGLWLIILLKCRLISSCDPYCISCEGGLRYRLDIWQFVNV